MTTHCCPSNPCPICHPPTPSPEGGRWVPNGILEIYQRERKAELDAAKAQHLAYAQSAEKYVEEVRKNLNHQLLGAIEQCKYLQAENDRIHSEACAKVMLLENQRATLQKDFDDLKETVEMYEAARESVGSAEEITSAALRGALLELADRPLKSEMRAVRAELSAYVQAYFDPKIHADFHGEMEKANIARQYANVPSFGPPVLPVSCGAEPQERWAERRDGEIVEVRGTRLEGARDD